MAENTCWSVKLFFFTNWNLLVQYTWACVAGLGDFIELIRSYWGRDTSTFQICNNEKREEDCLFKNKHF